MVGLVVGISHGVASLGILFSKSSNLEPTVAFDYSLFSKTIAKVSIINNDSQLRV
jgi:hypothetical protein